jgi:hypothetical protein
MRRVMSLVGVPLGSAFVGTYLAIPIALPTFVEAQQDTRMRAEVWSLVGAGDQERVRIATVPLNTATTQVLSADGVRPETSPGRTASQQRERAF